MNPIIKKSLNKIEIKKKLQQRLNLTILKKKKLPLNKFKKKLNKHIKKSNL
jgi:hypothetical protein